MTLYLCLASQSAEFVLTKKSLNKQLPNYHDKNYHLHKVRNSWKTLKGKTNGHCLVLN